MMSIGQQIKSARKANSLTRSALAESVGVPTKVILDYELDRVKEHRIPVLINIAHALGTNLDDFMQYLRTQPLDAQVLNNQLHLIIEALDERNKVTLLSLAKSLKSQQKTPEQLTQLKLKKPMRTDGNNLNLF